MESAKKASTPNKQKQRERQVSFPNNQETPSKTRGRNSDLYSRSRTRSHSSEDVAQDLAAPLHGDLSFSMPHFGPDDGTDEESSENQAGPSKLKEEEDGDVEMAYITPRRRRNATGSSKTSEKEPGANEPPSFARSEFETIVRRLRNRNTAKKPTTHRPRFRNMSYDWQFAGWGSMSYLDLTPADLQQAKIKLEGLNNKPKLDQYRATSIAGNAVWGSVYYSLPAIAAVADIYSPICMLVACSILFLLKPILLELGSAMRIDGASYTYMLNTTTKFAALVAGTITVIDAVATGIVSAATAASYIGGETSLPFPEFVLAIIILAAFTGLFLLGVKESSGVTLTICAFHCLTMLMLVIAAIIHWAKEGSDVISENWNTVPSGIGSIPRSIFNGICIGLLGVTGFESAPAYISSVRPDAYPKVLRNLIIGAISINLPVLLSTYAVLPRESIMSGANILSLVGQRAAGSWLRIIIVIDSAFVLCGGVLTGAITTCGLVERLAQDRGLPSFFLRTLPNGALWAACALYLGLGVIIYASSGFSLAQSSNVFSMSFMSVLFAFVFAGLMLKINRNALMRSHRTSASVVVVALAVISTTIIGNLVQTPIILLLWGVALVVMMILLTVYQNQPRILRWILYLYDNARFARKWNKNGEQFFIRRIKELNKHAVCVWIKTDDIATMVRAELYVRQNEATSRLVFIHAYTSVSEIPFELEANAKWVDEAFPAITTDLVLVRNHSTFGPELVHAVAEKLGGMPHAHFFGNLDDDHYPLDLTAYHGIRIWGG